jgi:hypothetical protein
MENTKPVVEDEPLWLSKMKPKDRQKALRGYSCNARPSDEKP